jgi:hypothetical protein
MLVAPVTDQERVTDCPVVMEDGVATNEEIDGADTGADCVVTDVADDWDEVLPAASYAETVYE